MALNKPYYTTGDLARALGVSVVAVKKWIRQGKLRAFRTPGGHFRVEPEEFRRLQTTYGFPAGPAEVPRILVVDDDPEMVSLLLDSLRGLRPAPKLEAALDGYEGVLKVGTFRPHVLVLDLRMAGLDGFEVCRRIKRDPALGGTRIVAITAYPERFARDRALACGADAYLTKPFDVRALRREVRRLLRRPWDGRRR
jgi:excisionase family DNA binding protein